MKIADRLSLMDYWYDKESETCFDLVNDDYGTVEGYKEAGYTILPAEEFIRLNTEVEIEPSKSFTPGDKLYHHSFKWVTLLNAGWNMCVIKDCNGNRFSVNTDLLSFTEYTLQGFSQERPKPEIKEGQLIYVRKGNGSWEMRFFSNWDEGMPSCYDDQKKEGSTYTWPEYSLTNPLEEK